jgi:hypothetical protein
MGWTLAVVLAVDLVVLAGFWLLVRRWLARRLSAPRQAADLGDEVGRLVTELNQATERNVVLLEDRVAALNDLLAAADKKIGLLRRESERHDAGARVYGQLAGPRTRAAAAAAADADSAGDAVKQIVQHDEAPTGPRERPVAARAAAATASGIAETAVSEPMAPVAQDARTAMRAEIARFARAGLAPAAIAARVGAPLGEVELILSLEQRARGS